MLTFQDPTTIRINALYWFSEEVIPFHVSLQNTIQQRTCDDVEMIWDIFGALRPHQFVEDVLAVDKNGDMLGRHCWPSEIPQTQLV